MSNKLRDSNYITENGYKVHLECIIILNYKNMFDVMSWQLNKGNHTAHKLVSGHWHCTIQFIIEWHMHYVTIAFKMTANKSRMHQVFLIAWTLIYGNWIIWNCILMIRRFWRNEWSLPSCFNGRQKGSNKWNANKKKHRTHQNSETDRAKINYMIWVFH